MMVNVFNMNHILMEVAAWVMSFVLLLMIGILIIFFWGN